MVLERETNKISERRTSPSKVNNMLLHLVSPTTKKEAQYLVSLSSFWKQHSLHLGVLL